MKVIFERRTLTGCLAVVVGLIVFGICEVFVILSMIVLTFSSIGKLRIVDDLYLFAPPDHPGPNVYLILGSLLCVLVSGLVAAAVSRSTWPPALVVVLTTVFAAYLNFGYLFGLAFPP